MTRRGWTLTLGLAGAAAWGLWLAWNRRQTAPLEDDAVTAESEDSFPASDAPSHTPLTGSRAFVPH